MKLLETHRGTSLPTLSSFLLCVDLPSRHMMGRFWGTACVSTPQHFLPYDRNIHGQVHHIYWHTFQKCFQNHNYIVAHFMYTTQREKPSMPACITNLQVLICGFRQYAHTIRLGSRIYSTIYDMRLSTDGVGASIRWIAECNLDIGTTHV